ncbi:UNVERIFIED_CONTAM: hypothetical protein RMT77_010659 [Armadillidium vulgare]
MTDNSQVLCYKGCNFFRQRLILSCLSGKAVKIVNIRSKDEEPGLKDFEVSFIRLIDRICNGSKLILGQTGTEIKFKPGILNGGKFEHTCPSSRSIGYFLEPLMILAPFMKFPLDITFRGVTNNNIDPSVDQISYSMLPVLKRFLIIDEGLIFKVERRGLFPKGGGVVHFRCPILRSLKAFQWEDMGKVQKIRGSVHSSRVAPTISNRILESAKTVLKNYLQDIYFTCDNTKGSCPGFGMCLVAKTNTGTCITVDITKSQESNDTMTTDIEIPEDLGKKAAFSLLEEIHNAGVVDSLSQTYILALMVLGPKDVSKVVLGILTPYTINFLKHIKDFFGVSFKIDPYKEQFTGVDDDTSDLNLGSPKFIFSCMGVGYTNISKPQL